MIKRTWWRRLGRTRRALAAIYVGGVIALVVTGEISETPWPYLLATLVTLPLGIAAFIAQYPAWVVVSGVVSLFVGSGDHHDRLALFGLAPVSIVNFAVAAIGNVWLLDSIRSPRHPSPGAVPTTPP